MSRRFFGMTQIPRGAEGSTAARDKAAGNFIYRRRRALGLSPEALGYEAGVSGNTIRRIEQIGCIPNPRTQFLLARFLETEPWLIWEMRRKNKRRKSAPRVEAVPA